MHGIVIQAVCSDDLGMTSLLRPPSVLTGEKADQRESNRELGLGFHGQ